MKNILFILLIFTSLTSFGQEISCDSNSCIKRKTGVYQVELVKKCSGHLNIDVLDNKGKPLIDTDIIGYVDFFYLDKTYAVEELSQRPKTSSLEAAIPYPGFYNIKITLIIKEKTISVYFDNACTLRATSNFGTDY